MGGGQWWQQPQQPVTHPTHPPFITHPPSQPTQPPAYPTQPPAYPTQPPAQTPGPPQTAPVVVEETDDSSSSSAGNYPARCGVGKYYPIRYNGNGTVAEEQERIDNDGQHPFRVVNGWPADKYEWPWIAALLPSGHQKYAGQTATVIGWGSLKENGPQPNTLMVVTVKIWDNPTCKDTYGKAAPGGIMDHMLCA